MFKAIINKIKAFILKTNNKITTKLFLKYPEYVSVQFLEQPVKPKENKKISKLNMGFNPKRRGKTIFTQAIPRSSTWKYNPYFISFLKAVMDMDAFPDHYLNGKKNLTSEYEALLNDLEKLGASAYRNAFIKNEKKLVENGIISTIERNNIKTVYINEWDLLIAAVDAYAMFKF
jgi:hypothetical protein